MSVENFFGSSEYADFSSSSPNLSGDTSLLPMENDNYVASREQQEGIIINPRKIGVDLDGTIMTIEEDYQAVTITKVTFIPEKIALLRELKNRGAQLVIYTSGLINRIQAIDNDENFRDILDLFDEIYTRESLLNDDIPSTSTLPHIQQSLLQAKAENHPIWSKWQKITIPNSLSEQDKARIQHAAKNRGKIPALAGVGTMLDDKPKKTVNVGDQVVRIVNPEDMPTQRKDWNKYIDSTFPALRAQTEIDFLSSDET